jgi:Ca2+-binding EF-hand superfamily protein
MTPPMIQQRTTDKVPAGKFKSAISLALSKQVPMTSDVLEGLAAKYAVSDDPGMVDYRTFLSVVDVNSTVLKDLHLDPLKAVALSQPKARSSAVYIPSKAVGDTNETDVDILLAKIRSVVSNRRPNLKPVFEDFDRMHLYQVTREQFMRVLAQELSKVYLSQADMETLAFAFSPDPRANKVDYLAFIQTVDDMFGGPKPSGKSKSAAGMAGQSVVLGANRLSAAQDTVVQPDRSRLQHDALNKARRVVKSLRVRLCEFLEDSNRLRPRVISMDQFLRGMSRAQLPMSTDEFRLLAEPFVNHEGLVRWRDLLAEIQRVEWETDLQRNPLKSGEPVPIVQPESSCALSPEEIERTDRILQIVRADVLKHRVILEPPFVVHDKLNHGKLTTSLFRRALSTLQIQPLAQQSEEDLALLAHRFLEPGVEGMVNYVAFIRAVDYSKPNASPSLGNNSNSNIKAQDAMTRQLQRQSAEMRKAKRLTCLADDPAIFEDLLTRLKDQCWSRGVRVKDFLCDFDRLRKGRIQASKFLGALKSAGLVLTPNELEVLRNRFKVSGDSDMINYIDFVYLIDGGDERLERDPCKTVIARVGRTSDKRNVGYDVSQDDITRVLAPMRRELTVRPLDLKEQFKHFDRQNVKAVTVSQLSSVLKTNNLLPQDPTETLAILHKAFPSSHHEKVDFRTFIRALESSK